MTIEEIAHEVTMLRAGVAPSGSIMMFGTSTAPDGWMVCDGTAVSRTTYSALFSAIGTTWGAGDGSTTFNLPDSRGLFPKGAGTNAVSGIVDANGVPYAGTHGQYRLDQGQGHKHLIRDPAGAAVYGLVSGGTYPSGGSFSSYSDLQNYQTASPKTDGSNGTPRCGVTTEPASFGVTYIIKA